MSVRVRLASRPASAGNSIELFRQQTDEALAFLGVDSIHELDPTFLDLPAGWPARQPQRAASLVS